MLCSILQNCSCGGDVKRDVTRDYMQVGSRTNTPCVGVFREHIIFPQTARIRRATTFFGVGGWFKLAYYSIVHCSNLHAH